MRDGPVMLERFLRGRVDEDLVRDERAALEAIVARTITFGPREEVVARGKRLEHSYYLIEGYALRHLSNHRGERQLVQVSIPGDFVDLHAFPMKRLDHGIEALTRVKLAEVPHSALAELVGRRPHLARILWFSTLLDAAMHREWLFCLGRLNAECRIAHLIVELAERLRLAGLYSSGVLPIPLLQRDFAEASGISAVHANRCFRVLQERGVVTIDGDARLRIVDMAELKRLSQFDSAYLYGDGALKLDTLADQE